MDGFPRLSTEQNPIRIRVLGGQRPTAGGLLQLTAVIELPPGAKVIEANYEVEGGEAVDVSASPGSPR